MLYGPDFLGCQASALFKKYRNIRYNLIVLVSRFIDKGKRVPKILMYTSASCPFCMNAEMLLKQKGVTEIEKIRIDLDHDQRDIMMTKTGRRTVPQIYIGDHHVGGFDDLRALDQAGGLDPLLAQV